MEVKINFKKINKKKLPGNAVVRDLLLRFWWPNKRAYCVRSGTDRRNKYLRAHTS